MVARGKGGSGDGFWREEIVMAAGRIKVIDGSWRGEAAMAAGEGNGDGSWRGDGKGHYSL